MLYVLSFAASEFVNFRKIEFDSLLNIFNVECQSDPSHKTWSRPYVVVNLESDDIVLSIVKRSVLIKCVYHLWSDADTLPELIAKVICLPSKLVDPYLNGSDSFKMILSSAHKKLSQDEKNDIIQAVLDAHASVEACVSLKSPVVSVAKHLGEMYGKPIFKIILVEVVEVYYWLGKQAVQKIIEPCRFYYGRLVGNSIRKDLINKYRLSDRTYLGNTTMNVCLAGIMANVGLCKKSSMVWDPFVGTGSTILASSIWGSYGGGSDIDYTLLHGRGMSPKAGQGKRMDGECLRLNYEQYNLESRFLDVIVADATRLCQLLRIPSSGLFDAIVTDPPYGVRERSCRVANDRKERTPTFVTRERLIEITNDTQLRNLSNDTKTDQNDLFEVPHDLPHYPYKESYPVKEVYRDLLNVAVHLLCPGSRIIFWLPILRSEFKGLQSLPHHSRLKLLGACEQVFNVHMSRYMIVMRKLFDYEPDENKLFANDDESLLYPAIC